VWLSSTPFGYSFVQLSCGLVRGVGLSHIRLGCTQFGYCFHQGHQVEDERADLGWDAGTSHGQEAGCCSQLIALAGSSGDTAMAFASGAVVVGCGATK
jgi:hypothetical protein